MAIPVEPQIYSQFKGIREIEGMNSGGAISALSAINVEFFNSDIGNGTGIRTSEGNRVFKTLPSGFIGVKCFTSKQNAIEYLFVYAENDSIGKLFYYDAAGVAHTVQISGADVTFAKTGEANGITVRYGSFDMFVFTNGKTAYTISFAQSTQVRQITAIDNQDRTLEWLSMSEWNGFLVVASQYGVHASHKNDFYTWDDVIEAETASVDSWYIDFSKKVTAVVSFATGLFIFTGDDISHLNASPNLSNSVLSSVAMNGCFNYESFVCHSTYLFFYDNNQKNIFYIKQTDTGLTQPAGPVAQEIQSFFDGQINRCKLYSCVYGVNNEIWMIINDKVIIFDYQQGEFIERQQTPVNAFCMYGNRVFSVGSRDTEEETTISEVRAEKISGYNNFYYPAEYRTSIINFGSNTNLKKEKTPILLVLNENYTNNFWVEVTANYKAKSPKKINIKVENQGIWASTGGEQNQYNTWGVAYWASENPYKKRVVEISAPQTWYNMSLRFYTEEYGQGFSIESMELKRIKQKTKTKGR